jgi:hypothetical protein
MPDPSANTHAGMLGEGPRGGVPEGHDSSQAGAAIVDAAPRTLKRPPHLPGVLIPPCAGLFDALERHAARRSEIAET